MSVIVYQVVDRRRIEQTPVMPTDRPAFELPLLLATAFRALVDELHETLATAGHPDARPLHGFALQAVGEGATISELGRRLGVTKQAAAKTAASLERLGYVERAPDPADGRATRLQRTARGCELLELSAGIFGAARGRLAARIGRDRVALLEDDLELIAGPGWAGRIAGIPGWLG
jgi:DNA-binding MarR family transcriptional regulator